MPKPRGVTPTSYQTADGREVWRVKFRDAAGRTTTRTSESIDDAFLFADLLKKVGPVHAEKIMEARATATTGAETLTSFATYHVDTLTGITEYTRNAYRRIVKNDLGILGSMPLDAITKDDIRAWVRIRQEETGNKAKTIKNKHGFLSSVFAHAEENGLVTSNPCRGTRLPRDIVEDMVFLTHSEYSDFLDCFIPYWQPLVATLFTTGLRWGEAAALKISDVDFDGGTISIIRAVKGGGVIGAPKSKRSRRTIAVPEEILGLLKPLTTGRSGDDWLFLNQQGNQVKHITFYDNEWQPAVRLANGESANKPGVKRVTRRRLDHAGNQLNPLTRPIGKRPRIHDARHSCASWLLGAGVPINYVQAHLGHESITTTVDRYGHVMPAAKEAIRYALSNAITGAHPLELNQ